MARTTCPTCGTVLELTDEMIGQTIECGSCHQQFLAEGKETTRSGSSSRKSKYRKDREEEDDDAAPRRKRKSSRNAREDDDEAYDDSEPRKPKPNGLALTSMILGIVAIVIELPALGGSFALSFCCCGWATWPLHGIGVVCALIGLVMGMMSVGDKKAKSYWLTGIITSGVAIMLAIAGVIISIAYPAAIIATQPSPPAFTAPPPNRVPPRQPGFPR